MKGIFGWPTKSNSGHKGGLPESGGKGSAGGAILQSGRPQLLILKTAPLATLMLLLGSCTAPGESSSLAGLYGKEVQVTMEPTVITTATSSDVRENKMNGKLIAADDNWVVLNTSPETVALSREKVITIAEVQARP